MSSVLLVASLTLELVLLKLMFLLMASVARTARFARAASMEIAVLQKDTVEKTVVVRRDVNLSLMHAMLRPISLPTVFVERMARSARGVRMATVVLLRATAVRRRVIVTQDARVLSVPVTAPPEASPLMASAVRMERPVRAARLVTVVHLKAGAERRRTIAARVVSPALGLVMPQLVTFLLMEAAARMARFARAVSGVIAAPRTATVERMMATAVMDVRQPMVSAQVFQLMPSAVQEMEKLVWDQVWGTAVLPMASAEALRLTAVRAAKRTPPVPV